MDNLSDILSNKDFGQPGEIVAIKEYIRRHYQKEVDVRVEPRSIIISASSSSLLSTLRLHVPDLQKAADTEKRLLFRMR